MNCFSENEKNMWIDVKISKKVNISHNEINKKYEKGEQRIITETNREKLPNFIEALKRPGYMELKPFYQRRARWDTKRQSKLIESFIVNIPVPPVFLYEKAYNKYEVMDGQQRITALQSFYNNEFKLTGLDLWPELNGMKYTDLPTKITDGLDRRSISSIVLLKESAPDELDAILLRRLVFERLNTGGIKLERQEIRNSLSHGPLNNLLHELSKNHVFREIWGLPQHQEDEENHHNLPIHDIPFFQKMEDLEVILRFFALRHVDNYKLGIQGFLDLYMIKSEKFKPEDIEHLRKLFTETINIAYEIYEDKAFRVFENGKWESKPSKSIFDAVMVGLSKHLASRDILIIHKENIIRSTKNIFNTYGIEAFTGRKSTKLDVENRLDAFSKLFEKIAASHV